MQKIIIALFFSCFSIGISQETNSFEKVYEQLLQLNFDEINVLINKAPNQKTKLELKLLSQILYNSGQEKKEDSLLLNKLTKLEISKETTPTYSIINAYYNLYYNRRGKDTYNLINQSYLITKKSKNKYLLKLSLLAFLNLYARENTLNKSSFESFLNKYKKISTTKTDEAWYLFYKNLYEGRSINGTMSKFKKLGEQNVSFLNRNYNSLSDALKSHLYENIGVYYRVLKKNDSAKLFLNKIIEFPNFPYLKENKFNSYLDLGEIAISENNIVLAKRYFELAKFNLNKADSIKSLISFKRFIAYYYFVPKQEYDSAFYNLNDAFKLNRIEISS